MDIVKIKFKDIHHKVRPHWRKILLFGGTGLLALVVIGQFLYPTDRLVPYMSIDGVDVGIWEKKDAIWQLNNNYAYMSVPVHFGTTSDAYRSPLPADIGLTIKNDSRINNSSYPWYLRIIPTSILWAHFISVPRDAPEYERQDDVLSKYITKELGSSCDVKPENASLKANDDKLEVIPAHSGGTCDIETVHIMLSKVTPRLDKATKVTVPVEEIPPDVSDADAKQLSKQLQEKAQEGVKITVADDSHTINTAELFSWIDFAVVDKKLVYSFNATRATDYLNKEIAAKVAINPGTTTISTYNFTETSRVNGAPGKTLDIKATLEGIKMYLDTGEPSPSVMTASVAPRITYKRSYSPTDTGLSALMQQYAQSHAGVFGVSLIELSGKNRRASYNDTKLFTTASTYKLFVAYSTLLRVESGAWKWSDQVSGGRNLSVCFDDMIVKSDNACAEALLYKIGFRAITDEARAIGCDQTSFLGNDGIKTSAGDLGLFLAQLQTGQILKQQTSRDRLINAMKRNIFRQGIPSGVSGVVANKVGFLWGLLHDA
ncbi:MAG TPA: serine hydrolase, partial [Candidatus Saccharimonadales bacterium]|nr:serine hydrolase [Candidatus Saccharimonadales bacterium]